MGGASSGFFENGPVLVAGPWVRSIVATQEQGNNDHQTSGFEAGLPGIGIPRDSRVEYEKALMKNQILVFIPGSLNEIR